MNALILLAVGLAYANAGDVVQLTDANFESTLESAEVALVKFYAPWCGHCKKLAPEFETAATSLLKNDPPVMLAEIDCTAETTQCGKFGVSGYPTLKIFKSGEKLDDYNGPRDADGIVRYMRSKSGPASKLLSDAASVTQFLDNEAHSIVGFFGSDSSDRAKSFQKLASALNEDFRFAHTVSADLATPYDVSETVVIFQPKRLHTKMEATKFTYEDSDDSLSTMKKWLNDNVHGLVGHRTQGNANQFNQPLVVAYFDVDYARNAKGTNYWRNRVIKVAKKVTETQKVFFAVSSKNEFGHELSEFGLENVSGDKPVVTAKNSKNEKFVMSDEFSIENLEKFVNDFMAGSLEAYMKSEPIPEDSGESVVTVVGKNFDEIVNDEGKDVLIEFYAPWCGHCKNLAPVYEEVAEKLKNEPEIVIAKMDATANDVPSQYQVSGFPTLYYSPRGSKQSPRKYEGGREAKDFIKYLARESTNPLTGYNRDGKKKKKEEL